MKTNYPRIAKTKSHLTALLDVFLLAAFGGGGASGGSATSGGRAGGGGGSSQPTATGLFVDAAVSGIRYTTATESGFTSDAGEFVYVPG
jgi:hypothetical protein